MSALQIAIRQKRYHAPSRPPHTVLDDVNFILPAGQFAAVVGPSGCGKTTLLNIIGGMDRAMDGEIRPLDPAQGAGLRIARVFQTPRLMPWLTVLDNVRLVQPSTQAPERADALLGELGLGDVLASYPRQLSGGMQRRVALARALVVEPELLLLDEPFVSLDRPATEQLHRLVLDLWRQHSMTVLLVTHDLDEALSLADRVLFLSKDPARLILDLPVDLPRPRSEFAGVEEMRRKLLLAHPELLSGRRH